MHANQEALLGHLRESWACFQQELDGLGPEQWNFREAEGRWTIGEIAEHVLAVERRIAKMVPLLPESEGDPSPDQLAKDLLHEKVAMREQKFEAPEFVRPANAFASAEEFLEAAKPARAAIEKLVGGDYDRHRRTAGPHPVFGVLDGHQWLWILSAHMRRHTLQVREVKDAAGYPAAEMAKGLQ